MKQITIISGKGGTGKTTLAASFASLTENKVIADCDVDVIPYDPAVTEAMKDIWRRVNEDHDGL